MFIVKNLENKEEMKIKVKLFINWYFGFLKNDVNILVYYFMILYVCIIYMFK